MDAKRAKEIADSPVMAHVTYHGTPVYIEEVDAVNRTASIHPFNHPHHTRQVPLSSLMEH